MPTAAVALQGLGRLLRLRCPHCGQGPVLGAWGRVRERCTPCGFRYERTNDSYFSGAMFFGLLLGEGVFALSLLIVVVSSWPDVPWDALTYGAPLGMLLLLPLLLPVSKVIWLSIDVLVRPVQPDELRVAAG
jgi:uncharacterized protein (DUF983 family)